MVIIEETPLYNLYKERVAAGGNLRYLTDSVCQWLAPLISPERVRAIIANEIELEAIRRLIFDLKPVLDLYEKYTMLDMNPESWSDETLAAMIGQCLTAPAARALFKIVTEHMPKGDEKP